MDLKINKNNQTNLHPWISPGWLCHFKTLLLLLFLFCIGNSASAQPKTITVGGTTYNLDGNDAKKWVTILKSNDPAILARTFRRDANNTNDDQWTGGSADPDLVNDWYWVSGNTNDKGDISNAGVVLIGKVIYFFGDRTAINGDAQIAFWFFQSGIQQNCTKGKGGFRFSGANADGDVLGISNFINGGGAPSITVYKRTTSGSLVIDNSAKTWLAVNSKTIDAPNTSADPDWKFSHTDACTNVKSSDFWTFTPKSGTDQTYPAPLFFEGAIDFSTEAGAKLCFNRFLLETRNSQSLSASLQDFVAGEFNVTPLPPTLKGDEKCVDKQPVTLTASCSNAGSSPKWYKKNTDGTYTELTTSDGVSADGSTLTKSGLPVGTTTFYATCYNATLGCESEKKSVDAIIYPLPTVDGVVTEGENANSIDDGVIKLSDDVYQIRISKTGTANLKATASGGSGSYTYTWVALDANTAITFTPSGANGVFNIVKPGPGIDPLNNSYSFKVTVSDGKNCVATDIVEIQPISSCPPCGIIGQAQACQNSSVTYTYGNPADGTPFTFPIQDYTLTWTLPDGSTVSDKASVTVKLTATGTNTVSISFKSASGLVDNCPGCKSSTDVRQVTCTVKLDANVSCKGVCDGKATVTATSGFEPYTYLWDNGETTQQATKLCGSETGLKHTVTVTDANKCTTTCDVTVTEPPKLTCTVKLDANVSCKGVCDGKATVTPAGGTAPFTYLWDDGETSVQATKLCGSETGLKHTVTVTDANKCTTTCDVTVTEPPKLTCTVKLDANVSCKGVCDGKATVTPAGGTAPFTYLWDDGETSVQATKLCGSETGLKHTVTVTDANKCTTTCDVTVTEPPKLTCTVKLDANVSCKGVCDGKATVTPAGGTAPFTYLWDDGETSVQATKLCGSETGLKHTVTVTDANKCTTTCDVTVTEPPKLTCTVKLDANTDCFVNNGKATVTPAGGTAPFTYLWDDGETSAQAVALSKGKHTVTVTDANKCQTSCDVTIPENPCQHIFCTNTTCLNFIQSTQILPNICYNTSNGTITPGVFYYWTNVTAPARNFTIKVTQVNGCGVAELFQLGSGNQFNLQSGTTCSNDGTTSTFAQDASGTVTVSVSGAKSGSLYILGIKYGAKSGAKFTSSCTYTFDASTTAGATTAHVDGSTGQITVALNCSATCVSAGVSTAALRSVPNNVTTTEQVNGLQVHAYPNPFNSIINFNFVSPVSGKARLEVFDLLGRKLANVYQGDVEANMQRSIPYKVPSAHMVPMIYKLTVGDRSTRGTLLPGNQEP